MSGVSTRLRVIGVSPRAGLVTAVARGGGLGVLDIAGPDGGAALRRLSDELQVPFGVRLATQDATAAEIVRGSHASAVLLGRGMAWPDVDVPVFAEVSDADEAAAAVAAGASGLIARPDDLSAFVLLQQLLEIYADRVPVWACDTGPRTAVGAVAGGAAGVVLDSQLALLPESTPTPQARADSSLAPLFADRFDGVESAVRFIAGSLRELPSTGPLEQGAPLCTSLGSTLPIVQGPMTRVSDQPGFAKAVAEHGGFPFVAVATASGPQTVELLARTADALGDRPWGAGILGFVAEDLRAAQLAAVRTARPRCVLVAGGKPAQAKALEADGIATYVHVPSPILLRQFLDAGVRRFVFEGAECGGHIGPRSSFVLWEQQLDVLRGRGPGIEVLFAGGIHDARSAAIVTAMAAELAAAGAGVGLLMGTAYLFAQEAVEHGAINGLFQDQVLAARTTVSLETAPGHRTRCLPSRYTEEFASVKAALVAEGAAPQDTWQRLEELNIGRSRIASKGLNRVGGEIVQVDGDAQLEQGMYMAGQIAALRDARTDLATLHREVTDGAAELLRSAARRDIEPAITADRDIAVVGMACAFPGAPDLASFWSQVLRGTDAVTEVPADRWDPDIYYGESTSKWGGFLAPLAFDPLSFGLPPTSMGSIDPAQLVSLEIARRALADAGYGDRPFGRPFERTETSVIFGAEAGGDLANAGSLRALLPAYLEDVPAELLDQLPELTEDSFPGTLANVISGRIANRLDLGGANYTVDAACGSSLAALDLAVKELRAGTSSMVLCGAVDLHNGINDYLMFTSAGALSPTGRCRPFDSTADGIALGEGVACLVLKRLSDAERDGDRVYAVVKGVGAASDGKALGLTAPRPEGQRRALERAYRDAGITPADVDLVEAHGTGTVVGDATELRTLTQFFIGGGAEPATVALGSVKSQIGHTKCAAGLAGLIKTVLALWHEVVPPTLHMTKPNSAWDVQTSPFTFSAGARPAPGRFRVGGVSAFGFGGTNFHTVLERGPVPPDRRHGLRDWEVELFLFRGASVDAARATLRRLLAENPKGSLGELAAAASDLANGGSGPVQLAVVAEDRADLEAATTSGGSTPSGAELGKIAFLFPGQGSQKTGMLAELFVHFPELTEVLRPAPDVAAAIFPPRAFGADGIAAQDAALKDTRMAQPALGLVETAVFRLLDAVGVRPDFLAGHSYGELVALSAAGAYDLPSLLALSRARATAIVGAVGEDPGAMAAVRASRADLTPELLGPDVVVANHNAPKQAVISGPTADVEAAMQRLRDNGIAATRIPVACAFHSSVVAPAADVFAADLDAVTVQDPVLPVWANGTAAPYETGAVRANLTAQIPSPVRFVDEIESMYAAGARTFVEVGPGRVLSRLVADILADRPHTVVGPDKGLRGLLTALATLAVAGIDVRTERLVRGRVRRPAASKPTWTVDGALVRNPDGLIPVGGLAPARRLPRMTMNQPAPVDRDQVIVEFLRFNRELVATQREVMLQYLGAAPAAATFAAPVPLTALPALPAVAPMPSTNGSAPPVVTAPAAEPPSTEPPADVDVFSVVVGAISARTGFPSEMINGEMDLEADLSIDSIKRTEIAGTLLTQLGLTERAGDDGPDLLSRIRTAGALAGRIEEWLNPGAAAPATPAAPATTPAAASTTAAAAAPPAAEPAPAVGEVPVRYIHRRTPAPLGTTDPARVRGRHVVIHQAPGQEQLAQQVRAAFADAGANVEIGTGAGDIVVSLTALVHADDPAAPQVFTQLKGAPGDVLVAAGIGVDSAVGLRGLIRAAALERDGLTRLVEVEQAADLGRLLVAEAATGEGPVVVRYDGQGERTTTEPAAVDLGSIAYAGAGPGGGELPALGLGPDSVVLLIGGARGITARSAIALAASGCRVELAGRTPWPSESADDNLPGDLAELRAVFSARGGSLAEVDRQARTVLAQQEIGRTVEQIRAAGGTAGYRVVDARDGAGIRQLVKDLHAQYGRIDGVVFAAGVIDDKLIVAKGEQSFRAVFATKVDGARALLDALADLETRPDFVALFGSISAVLGNRGQTDYAAANDALESLGEQWTASTGNRAVTVHWGPWAPDAEHSGMVSPELAREYGRRGVGLIDPAEGTSALLRELAYGGSDTHAVLYSASLW